MNRTGCHGLGVYLPSKKMKAMLRQAKVLFDRASITAASSISASCRKFGFVFHKDKLHKPDKRPLYKGAWVSDPLIHLEGER